MSKRYQMGSFFKCLMLLLIKHNNAGMGQIKKAKQREWERERDTERYQKRQRLIKNLMSCWWVSALRDTQSDASNHCTRPSGGEGLGGDLQRTPCLLPSTTYASLPHYVMWNGIKAGLYYPQTVITPEFPPWHPSPHTLYSLINTRGETSWQSRAMKTYLYWPRERAAYTNTALNAVKNEVPGRCMCLFFRVGVRNVSKHLGLICQTYVQRFVWLGYVDSWSFTIKYWDIFGEAYCFYRVQYS